MKFVTVRELKRDTAGILKWLTKNTPVVVTYRSKPRAIVTPVSEDELEDFLFEHSPVIRKRIEDGLRDLKQGRAVSHEELKAKLLASRRAK